MKLSEKFQEWALVCMRKQGQGGGICDLKRPSSPVQELASDSAFRIKVLKACSRMDCDEQLIAVLSGTCEK